MWGARRGVGPPYIVLVSSIQYPVSSIEHHPRTTLRYSHSNLPITSPIYQYHYSQLPSPPTSICPRTVPPITLVNPSTPSGSMSAANTCGRKMAYPAPRMDEIWGVCEHGS
jgi:hypothetical protein